METPCRWRLRKHCADEDHGDGDHGNMVQVKTTETLCRWRPWKHRADEDHGDEDHGNMVQRWRPWKHRADEEHGGKTPCRQIHHPILLPKCQETWNHVKLMYYFQILKGCENFLLKSVSSQQKMQMLHAWIIWQGWPWDSKAPMAKCWHSVKTMWLCRECMGSAVGLSCSYLMSSLWWEVEGWHFLMHFHWLDLSRNHHWHYLLKVNEGNAWRWLLSPDCVRKAIN